MTEIFINIPKWHTAMAEWSASILMIMLNTKHMFRRKSLITYGTTFAGLLIVQYLCGKFTNFIWLILMGISFLLMLWNIRNSIKLHTRTAVYIALRAFVLAEFIASLEWQIYHYYFFGTPKDTFLFDLVFCLLFYAFVLILFYQIENTSQKKTEEDHRFFISGKQLFFIITIVFITFFLSNMSYVYIMSPFSSPDIISSFNIRTLIDFAGVLLLFAFHIQKNEAYAQGEMTAIRAILRNQYLQYRNSQDNIAEINRKYHDLKNQLQIIREENDKDKRNLYLQDIEDGIEKFDSSKETGNTVLDTILTEKGNQCRKKKIALTVVADGKLLNHIYVMDLCTIFGNALDNAMECEIQIPEEEKRLIHITVSQKQNFVFILIENYFEGYLEIDGGFPVTTKSEKEYHGYGIKSIQYAVKKYGGHLKIKHENEWFKLQILLPKEEA